jgi:hypothetical protein
VTTNTNHVLIGTWHEAESRDIRRCPSYYAADFETLRTQPGDFELRLTFQGGYLVPMPQWLLVSIDAERIDGALYSGFGGLNFASTPLPVGERVVYHEQMYVYQLRNLVERDRVTLRPGFEWVLCDKPWEGLGAPQTWDAVRTLCSEGPKLDPTPAVTSNAAPPSCQNESIDSSNEPELTGDTRELGPAP